MAASVIQIERTPNPDALRILPGVTLLSGVPREYRFGDDCGGSPLADELLTIEGIRSVMIAPSFVSVVRSSAGFDWSRLRPQLLAVVADFLLSGRPAVLARDDVGGPDFGEDLVSAQIHDVIERFVRPMVGRDGGDVTLLRFDPATGVAHVRMSGACGGCPSGTTTLKRGIEQAIRRYVPEVTAVEAGLPKSGGDPRARFRAWVAARWGGKTGTTIPPEPFQ